MLTCTLSVLILQLLHVHLIMERLIKFFHSVFTQNPFNVPPLDQPPQPHSTLSDITMQLNLMLVQEGLIEPCEAYGHQWYWGKSTEALCLSTPILHLLSITKARFTLQT